MSSHLHFILCGFHWFEKVIALLSIVNSHHTVLCHNRYIFTYGFNNIERYMATFTLCVVRYTHVNHIEKGVEIHAMARWFSGSILFVTHFDSLNTISLSITFIRFSFIVTLFEMESRMNRSLKMMNDPTLFIYERSEVIF